MDGKRFRIVLQAVLAVCVLVFLLLAFKGMSMLSSKSNELVTLKLKDKTVQAQLTSLAVAKKEVETYSYFKDLAKTVIPEDKDQAQAVLEITRLASQSGINVGSITFPNSNLGAGAPASAQSGQAGAANAQSASPRAAISQAKPVEGIAGVYSLELTIVPETGVQVPADRKATYPKLLEFLRKLENNRRTAQIVNVTIQPEGDETNLTPYIDFSLIINIFIKP